MHTYHWSAVYDVKGMRDARGGLEDNVGDFTWPPFSNVWYSSLVMV